MNFPGIASIVGGLLLTLAALVWQENLKKLFHDWGWNAFLTNFWQRWRPKLHGANLRELWWLWLGSGAIGYALAFGTLWLVALLSPPVKWVSVLDAIDTFAPADVSRDYDQATKEWKDFQHQIEIVVQMDGPEQSSRVDEIAKRQAVARQKRSDAEEQALEYFRDQLKRGTLLAWAYDQDKGSEGEIPTKDWEFLQLRLATTGRETEQMGIAGGSMKHFVGVLLGKPASRFPYFSFHDF